MQSVSNVASRSLSENHPYLRANRPDTRRFATIFPPEVSEVDCFDFRDATCEEHDDDFTAPLRWQQFAELDDNTNPPQVQVASAASTDGGHPLNDVQQIAACCTVLGSNHALDYSPTELNEELSQISDDQHSMCTITSTVDRQSPMDMMWRPKPKIHMHRTDQMALMQAKSEAIETMHTAGLKPTDMIQCRRRGCADILQGVEALKYHLHIHIIADTTAKRNDALPPACGPSTLVQHSTCNAKYSGRVRSRSKSTPGTQYKYTMTSFPSGRFSAGIPLLPHLSTSDAQCIPSFTTVAKSFIPNHSRNEPTDPIPIYNDDGTNISAHSRDRRTRRGSLFSFVGAGSHNIATVNSPPSSPDTCGRFAFTPHTNTFVPLAHGSTMDCKDRDCVFTPYKSAQKVSEDLTGPRNPIRALSPTRAMSPIRNGIRRVLSIGHPVDPSD